MNAPAELAAVEATAADATHGYKSFTLGPFNFRRDEYFAHVGWQNVSPASCTQRCDPQSLSLKQGTQTSTLLPSG